MKATLRKRIISGFVAVFALFIMLYFRGYVLVAPGMVITAIAVYEFNHAFENINYKPMTWVAIVLSLLSMIVTFTNQKYEFKYAVFFVLIAYIVLLSYQMLSDHQIFDLMISVFSIIYVTTPMLAIMLLSLRKDNLIYLIFILAIFSDTFAFISGKLLGKTKLIERISPKKTVEGAIGGIIACVIATLVFRHFWYPEMGIFAAVVLGTLGSIASILGDLTASKIKRNCQKKDFGNIIPGHGGILDRIDSILFTAILVFAYYWLFIIH